MGRATQVKCHGDERRFEVLAQFIYNYFGNSIKYIADVAGGQGMLSRLLNKHYNYESEVIDPRHYVLKGVSSRETYYTPDMASFYDLIVGLHPDEATRPVAESAIYRPVLIVPCCNHWDSSKKLNSLAIVDEIAKYYDEHSISYERVEFPFKYPNVGLVSRPPVKK